MPSAHSTLALVTALIGVHKPAPSPVDAALAQCRRDIADLDASLERWRTRPICPEPELSVGTDRKAQRAVEAREEVNV